MKKIFFLLSLCMMVWGCPANNGKGPSPPDPLPGTFHNPQMLTEAILFKVAPAIQEKYLQYYKNQFPGEQNDFFKFLNGTALSKNNITSQAPVFTSKSSPSAYAPCAAGILRSDKSYWSIKKILHHHDFPGYVKNEGEVLFNPYIFLPEPVNLQELNREIDLLNLWKLFYTAILMDEKSLLEKTYPLLMEKVGRRYPRDREVLESIYHLCKRNNTESSQPCHADALAYYYLITGNLDDKLRLSEADNHKLRQKMDYYDRHYYPRGYIVVNAWTLKNRVFMWLAARQQEQEGNLNKAYVYIKTTFDNEVLRNIQKFHPNHQVYFYATLRIALNVHSPKIYRYVYGALDPLTKFKHTQFKELLKMQLLQLMN